MIKLIFSCIVSFLIGYFVSKYYNVYIYWCPSNDVKEAFNRLEQNYTNEVNNNE